MADVHAHKDRIFRLLGLPDDRYYRIHVPPTVPKGVQFVQHHILST